MNRLDLVHEVIYKQARHDQLHLAPLTPAANEDPPLRILDVGCGTGIWVIDMAEYVPFIMVSEDG